MWSPTATPEPRVKTPQASTTVPGINYITKFVPVEERPWNWGDLPEYQTMPVIPPIED
jgi:hypothetical protein